MAAKLYAFDDGQHYLTESFRYDLYVGGLITPIKTFEDAIITTNPQASLYDLDLYLEENYQDSDKFIVDAGGRYEVLYDTDISDSTSIELNAEAGISALYGYPVSLAGLDFWYGSRSPSRSGDDTLYGNSVSDLIFGGDGNDFLYSGDTTTGDGNIEEYIITVEDSANEDTFTTTLTSDGADALFGNMAMIFSTAVSEIRFFLVEKETTFFLNLILMAMKIIY